MKKVSVLFLLAALSLISISSFAQGKYGKDSVECTRNISFYTDYMKQGNLAEAAPLWREALKYCPPGVRQGLYVDGQKIIKFLIEKNKTNVALKLLRPTRLLTWIITKATRTNWYWTISKK